jgi:site-specific recombinase XerD
MKKIYNTFLFHLHNYFDPYLTKHRNYSKHTILAERQVWNVLLNFICKEKEVKIDKLCLDDIDHTIILKFLDSKESEKKWAPSTRNHRLALIRSFFKYLSGIDPTKSFYLSQLNNIPQKKCIQKTFVFNYMSLNAIKALLSQPGLTTKIGIRDTFFMSLMYNTASRDNEMLSMSLHDLDPNKKSVVLLGKGNKSRIIPIDDNTISQFKHYISLFHTNYEKNYPMFYTKRHGQIGPMSDDNVSRFIKQYAKKARQKCSEIPENVYPHMIRRTRAMHLYQGGMPLEVVALFLGHEDPKTTRIYAMANLEMKRKAMEKVNKSNSSFKLLDNKGSDIWVGNEDLIKLLCGL